MKEFDDKQNADYANSMAAAVIAREARDQQDYQIISGVPVHGFNRKTNKWEIVQSAMEILLTKVNQKIAAGWEPLGAAVKLSENEWYQTMIKRKAAAGGTRNRRTNKRSTRRQ
jgi:hypothetical protein